MCPQVVLLDRSNITLFSCSSKFCHFRPDADDCQCFYQDLKHAQLIHCYTCIVMVQNYGGHLQEGHLYGNFFEEGHL